MATTVKFEASRDSSPMTRIEGVASFPERSGRQPKVGEVWEVEVAGKNQKGTANFLRLIRKVEPEAIQPALPVLLPSAPTMVSWKSEAPTEELLPEPNSENATVIVVTAPNRGEVRINGNNIPAAQKLVGANAIEFRLPCRMHGTSSANKAFRLTPGNVYVLLYESYNARNTPSVKSASASLTEVFQYGDGHGMRWAALYKLTGESWSVNYDVPKHHDHGTEKKRVIGTRDSFEWHNAERRIEEAPLV